MAHAKLENPKAQHRPKSSKMAQSQRSKLQQLTLASWLAHGHAVSINSTRSQLSELTQPINSSNLNSSHHHIVATLGHVVP